MKLRNIGSNQTELTLANGNVIFFSYETPVAAYDKANACYLRTMTKFSRTTTKHINNWLDGANAVMTDQTEIETLAGGI